MNTKLRIVSGMMDENHIAIILKHLKETKNIPGDVVELGCNVGTTSIYIQSKLLKSKKRFYVYDSFEGLPEKSKNDNSKSKGVNFKKGGCPSTVNQFINHFNEFDLPLPRIHIGWFKDQDYPDKISFAFFDGDFYTSIMDSWEKVYPLLSPGAKVCIHDYLWPPLPGVEKACTEFLSDKPEAGTIVFENYIGVFTKL